MPEENAPSTRKGTFGNRNWVVMVLALGTLGAGYGLLALGSASAAAVLLVLGYVVLFPLAIAI